MLTSSVICVLDSFKDNVTYNVFSGKAYVYQATHLSSTFCYKFAYMFYFPCFSGLNSLKEVEKMSYEDAKK
jgi:hypothetical protein